MWTLRTRLRRGWLGQIRKDRAFLSVIPVAVVGQMLERLHHRLQLGDSRLQSGGMGKRHRLDVGACAVTVAPQDQQFCDLFDREAKVSCATDKAKADTASLS